MGAPSAPRQTTWVQRECRRMGSAAGGLSGPPTTVHSTASLDRTQ